MNGWPGVLSGSIQNWNDKTIKLANMQSFLEIMKQSSKSSSTKELKFGKRYLSKSKFCTYLHSSGVAWYANCPIALPPLFS